MDSTALALCMDNNIPLIVFNFQEPGSIRRAVSGAADRGTSRCELARAADLLAPDPDRRYLQPFSAAPFV